MSTATLLSKFDDKNKFGFWKLECSNMKFNERKETYSAEKSWQGRGVADDIRDRGSNPTSIT